MNNQKNKKSKNLANKPNKTLNKNNNQQNAELGSLRSAVYTKWEKHRKETEGCEALGAGTLIQCFFGSIGNNLETPQASYQRQQSWGEMILFSDKANTNKLAFLLIRRYQEGDYYVAMDPDDLLIVDFKSFPYLAKVYCVEHEELVEMRLNEMIEQQDFSEKALSLANKDFNRADFFEKGVITQKVGNNHVVLTLEENLAYAAFKQKKAKEEKAKEEAALEGLGALFG